MPPVTPGAGPLVRAANLGEPVAPPSPAVLAQQEADARAREVEDLTGQLDDVQKRIDDLMKFVGDDSIVTGSNADTVLQDLVGRRTALQDRLGITPPLRPTSAGPSPQPQLPPSDSELAALMADPEMAGLMGELGGILGTKPAEPAPAAPVAKAAGVQPSARERPAPKNPFGVFLRKNGIDPGTARDILGEDAMRGNRMLPGAIRRGGMQIDKLAEAAVESGYLTPADLKAEDDVGGTRKLAELIRGALQNKQQVQSVRQLEGGLDAEMQAAADERYGEEPAGPPRPSEMDDEGGRIADAPDEDAADAELAPLISSLMDELKSAVGDDAALAVAERLSRMLEGRSADEYAAQLGVVVGQAQEQAAARARAAQEPARPVAGEGAQGGEGRGGQAAGREGSEGEDPPVLTSYTPDDVVRRQEEAKKAAAEKAKRDAAPPPDDFQLTGSDRPADVAAAAGQMELAPPAAPDDGRVTKNSGLPDGATVKDGEGREYRVHYQRNALVLAHPIENGKANVSRDTTVRFWTDPDVLPSGDRDRTDPIYLAAAEPAPVSDLDARGDAWWKSMSPVERTDWARKLKEDGYFPPFWSAMSERQKAALEPFIGQSINDPPAPSDYVLYTGKNNNFPYVIDREAMMRNTLESDRPIVQEGMPQEYADMFRESGLREARKNFDKDGKFTGRPYQVTVYNGVYLFDTLADAQVFAETRGLPKGKKRPLTMTPAGARRRPKTDPLQAKLDEVKGELGAELDKLAGILGAKKNITPEDRARLMPVLSKVGGLLMKAGYLKFRMWGRKLLELVRSQLGEDAAAKLTIDDLQSAYISARQDYPGTDSKLDVLGVESLAQLNEDGNDQRRGPDLEPDRPGRPAADAVGPGLDADGPGADQRPAPAGAEGSGRQGRRPDGGTGVSVGGATGVRTPGDPAVSSDAPGHDRPSGDQLGEGGLRGGGDRLQPESDAGEVAGSNAEQRAKSLADRIREQEDAEAIDVVPGDLDNIRATLPLLLEGQQDDVAFAEARFAKPDGHGVMFTHGTGVGKTITALGVMKRQVRMGAKNILAIAPSQGILDQWIADAKMLGLELRKLTGIRDAGGGLVVTTYKNLEDNRNLADLEWDMVVADEAHNLLQNEEGDLSIRGHKVRAITHHPAGFEAWFEMKDRALFDARTAAEEAKDEARVNDLDAKITERRRTRRAEYEALPRRKALFLSATPFAYEKAIEYAEGYLFEYGEGGQRAFLQQHFGWRIRNNKLTQPDANVDRDLMQVRFNQWLKDQGALSGRMLDSEYDYSRNFWLIDDAIGKKIDDGILFLREGADGRYRPLYYALEQSFDYLTRARLLEAIKAKHAVPLIKQYIDLNRKVVVFYDYNSGGGIAPFQFDLQNGSLVSTKDERGQPVTIKFNQLAAQFRSARPDLWNMDFSDYPDPVTHLTASFDKETLGVYRGATGDPERARIKREFNSDASKMKVILVQAQAGGAGLSLHDTTGRFPRVLMNVGLPVAPVTSIQQEGRGYRVGQKSSLPIGYFSTGTMFEARAFSEKIAERAGTAENLGMGVLARGLKRSFRMAFAAAAPVQPGAEGEGTGGKRLDRSSARKVTPSDEARTLYFAQQKKNQRTKGAEGEDYYPTPEPVGLAMANWLGLRNGERALEPSAGHGAIAQWFGGQLDRTALEPSYELATRLKMVFDGNVREERFEELDTRANKFDGIAMNPPFGVAGARAIAHLAKAFKHTNNGGRVVAILPRGATDAKFDALMAGPQAKGFYTRASIELPGIAFERAGTKVRTRLVIIDRLDGDASKLTQRSPIDLSGVADINELFDRIEAIEMPMRPGVTKAQMAPDATPLTEEQRAATVGGALTFSTEDRTSQSGQPALYARANRRVSGEAFEALRSMAKRHGGFWANLGKPGFVFRKHSDREAFVREAGGMSGPDVMMSKVAPGELDVGRRAVITAMAAAAVAPRVGRAGPVTIGRAQATAEQVLASKVAPEVEAVLRAEEGQKRPGPRDRAITAPDGAKRTRRALEIIARTGPPELRALAGQIAKLMPADGVMLTVDDSSRVNAHGIVRFFPMPELRLFTRDGRQGLSHATFLHEALHVAVLARYRSLSVAIPRGNDARIGMPAPQAAAALEQFRAVWREFGDMAAVEMRGMADEKLKLALEEAVSNPDEFFVRALTDAGLQQWMAAREYKGKTLWQRFKDWIKTSLFGMSREGTAPSWLDAALAASNDLVSAMETDPADFARLQASAALEDRGRIGQQRDAMYARMAMPTAPQVRNVVHDLMKSHKNFNWWHKTIGTQYEKANARDKQGNLLRPHFKAVFDRVQTFLDDISRFANQSADLAPTMLPRLGRLSDALDPKDPLGRKRARDAAAIARPIFEGTLADQDPAKGKIWTDQELRTQYQLTADQIRMYREFRAAVDKSLDTSLRATLVKVLGEKALGIEDQIMAAPDATALESVIVTHLTALQAQATQSKKAAFTDAMTDTRDKIKRVEGLKAGGYAPLMRFGNHSVYAYRKDPVTGDIDQLYFGMYDTEREANAARRALEADPQMAGATFEQGPVPTEAFKLFNGFDPDAVELFAQAAGVTNDEMVQQYIKLTKNNRSALRRMIKRTGLEGFSQDTTRTLAGFITSSARQASMDLHSGEMKKAAEQIPKTQGDVQNEAVRLIEYVQTPADTGAKIRSLLFFQFIGGSIASAITNLTQPVTMTFPYLSQFGGATLAGRELARAGKEATTGVRDPAIAAALARAEDEGIVSPQEIHHLYSEAGAGVSSNNAWRRFSFVWGSLFSASEQWNRRTTFLAAYRIAQANQHADPFAFAEQAVEETQGIYNKGNRPNWARGAVGGLVLTFKQFSVAYVEFFKRLPRKQKAIALAVLILFAGLEGVPFAEDLQDLIDTLAQAAGYNFSTKRAARAFAARIVGQDAAEFIMRGTSTVPGFPIDVSARMGLGNLVPGTGLFMQSKTDKTRELTEPLGAFGSLVRQGLLGAERAFEGEFGAAAKAVLPVAAANAIKGIDMAATGMYRDERGRRVVDTTTFDAMMKSVGFQPADVAQAQRTVTMAVQRIDMARNREGKIAEKWARGIFEGKPDVVAEARAEMRRWNELNPDSQIAINSAQVQRRVKAMRLSRADRIAKTAPREFRRSVQDEVGALR
ncbi:MAG: PLxRFG domain-containing protein [Tagaea sp.]